ncbi:uncharacterized protein LOC135941005 isoform X1 [Cloeon dipterum]|uniref:uncharacterized protein LOC135941005 isoform X1 n=2 Tax=Cloeon dipterum TaxID=197152 RepID=UPI00321F7D8D
MVSPSKKRKLENKTLIKSSIANTIKTADLKIRRTSRPLVDYRFYLDLKNHADAAKIESRLKTLGAVVDDFLAKEVKYVVTDRPERTAAPTGQGLAASPAVPQEGRKRAQKSRADAMLEKARLQQTNISSYDVLENAFRWGIPIWPLENLSKWLEKIENSLQNNVPALRIRPFKGPFIKIEDINKRYKPLYGNLASWPSINLDYGCPFSTPKLIPGKTRNAPVAGHCQQLGEQRMTRKSKVPKPEEKAKSPEVLYPGYCEICEIDYVDLKQHVISSTHVKFTEDSTNYEDLDNLIKYSTVEDLVKASQPRRSPRGAAVAEPLAPPCDSEMRKLPVGVCNGQLRRCSVRQAESKARKECPAEVSLLSARCTRTRLTEPTPLAQTNGKRDEFIHNLRKRYPASADGCCRHRLRSRNSEGSEDVSDEMGGTDSKPKTEQLNGKAPHHLSEEDSSCSSSLNIKRKRLSVEEKLLEDNKEYYRLEVKSAKLRSSAYICQVNKVEYDDECANHVPSTPLAEQLSSIKEEDSLKQRRSCSATTGSEPAKTKPAVTAAAAAAPIFGAESPAWHDLNFSFEHEPRSEPWYATYQRQDDGSCEFLEGFEDFHFRKRFLLPYEMPEFKRPRMRAKMAAAAAAASSPSAAGKRKYSARNRAMQLVADAKNPRKSPRCHASTLAILSNLMTRRRRSNGASPDRGTTAAAAAAAAEAEQATAAVEDVDKELDEMLASPPTPEVSPSGRVRRKSARRTLPEETDDLAAELANAATLDGAVDLRSDMDVLHLVYDYRNCDCTHHMRPVYTVQQPEEEVPPQQHQQQTAELLGLLARTKRRLGSVSEGSTLDTLSDTGTVNSSSRGRFKKRKRNLTGWPSNKPKKRQAAKPAEDAVDAAEDFVGVTIKVVKEKGTKGKVKTVYRTKKQAAAAASRGKAAAATSPSKRRARSESPRKAVTAAASVTGTQTSPVRKKLVVNRTCRARTRNSTRLRR